MDDRRLGWVKIVIAQLNLNRLWILKHHWKAVSEARAEMLIDFEILRPLGKYLVRISSLKMINVD